MERHYSIEEHLCSNAKARFATPDGPMLSAPQAADGESDAALVRRQTFPRSDKARVRWRLFLFLFNLRFFLDLALVRINKHLRKSGHCQNASMNLSGMARI